MKKILHFSKLFVPAAVFSLAVILSGVVVLFTKGINLGIDFRPGLVTEIRIAPSAVDITYAGSAAVNVQISAQQIDFVVNGAGADNRTVSFPFAKYPDMGSLAAAMNEIEDVAAVLNVSAETPSAGVFANSQQSSVLSDFPYSLHIIDLSRDIITADDMRETLSGIGNVSVKILGADEENCFQIRVGDEEGDPEMSKKTLAQIADAVSEKYGAENFALIQTDFVGSQFSKSLVWQSALLVAVTLVLIWVYAWIRFNWDFAFGAVFAIIHDVLIMFSFIAWSQMEFTSTTIAAILTIVGYSINDTVVVLDRVRENVRMLRVKNITDINFTEILDISQSEVFGRTIITTVTTLLAVFSLFFFTSGSMKDFALALIVGMISGVYSTIYISGAFISFARRNWQPSGTVAAASGTIQSV